MPAIDFRRRSAFFVAFSGIVTLILVLLPFVETFVFGYLQTQFGLTVTSDGKVVSVDGTMPSMMSATSIELFVNLFHVLKVFLWMALVIAIVRFIGYLIFTTAFRNANQNEISSLVRTVLSIIIYIVAFFIIFQSQYPNVQLAPLFTGSTIVGIVVGLALQDTLGNLFAGIALQADQPFQVGDVVSISNRGSGIVESVSWRGVKIRTFQNKLLIISNAVLGRETIEVAPRDNLNARLVFFDTLYSDSPSKTATIVREAVRQVENVSNKIRPVVRVRNLGDHGLEWEVKYWCEDYKRYNDTDALIRQRIWYVFAREGVEFAFPTRTVHIEEKRKEITAEEFVDATSEQLSNVPIFAPLADNEIERLARASKKRVFAPGEAIVRKGQEGNSMFVILRGSVNVQLPEGNQPRIINKLRVNDFFGEMSLLTGQPRSATVAAEEETEVLEIRKSALKPIFESNPTLMDAIGEIIEDRRVKLSPEREPEAESEYKSSEKGVLAALKRFFGVGKEL
jgi:small-conductance mechanosensitive channel